MVSSARGMERGDNGYRRGMAEQEGGGNTVQLDKYEEHEVKRRVSLRAEVVFETIRRTGENELTRPALSLAFSGFAAGLSMGFSLVGTGVLESALPESPWRTLVSNFGYTFGFVIVILGAQQLFTENTLTAILPVLDDKDKVKKLGEMLRLWGIVLLCNLIGAGLFAWLAAHTSTFSPGVNAAFMHIGQEALHPSFVEMLLRAVLAGWLIALCVWLLPSADAQRFWIIIFITWLVGAANLSHIIAGSVETLYVVSRGAYPFGMWCVHFLLPVFIGNCIGGVGFVAILNYAQVAAPDEGQKQ